MSNFGGAPIANLLVYYDELIDYISKKTGSRQVALEVVQETYLKVLQKSAQFEHLDCPVAFLKKVSFNIALDHIKKNNHYHKYFAAMPIEVDCLDAVPNQYSQQELITLRQQYSAMIFKKICSLPPAYQDVLILTQFYQMTQIQVAEHLQLSRLTIMKYLEHALRHVLSVLEQES